LLMRLQRHAERVVEPDERIERAIEIAGEPAAACLRQRDAVVARDAPDDGLEQRPATRRRLGRQCRNGHHRIVGAVLERIIAEEDFETAFGPARDLQRHAGTVVKEPEPRIEAVDPRALEQPPQRRPPTHAVCSHALSW
jgi:hypothetical protein